jgi:hypothetical protein
MTQTILLNMRDARTLSGWTSCTGLRSLEVELVNHLSSHELPLLCRAWEEEVDEELVEEEEEELVNASSSKYRVSWYCHAW